MKLFLSRFGWSSTILYIIVWYVCILYTCIIRVYVLTYTYVYICAHSQFYSCLFLLFGESDILVHFAKKKDMELVSWMYIYVKWTRCQSNIAMLWPEEWHEAYRTLVCSKPVGWWWFCVLNDLTFFAWLYWPPFTQPTLALLQMLRRSFQEHVSHHIFRNLDLSS